MITNAPRISVFPKCYFDEIYSGVDGYLDWLRQAATLGGEGVEHYDGFFKHGVEPVRRVLQETKQISSMLCFSPDFTQADADERRRQVERQQAAVDLCVALDIRHCRTLSGQRYPGMSRKDGIERTVECIRRSLEYAEKRNVILCMENHYKDGTWQYSEFASRRIFSWRSLAASTRRFLAFSSIRRTPSWGASIPCRSWKGSKRAS